MVRARNKKLKERMTIVPIILLVILLVYTVSLLAMLLFGLNTSFKAMDDYNRNIGNNVIGLPNFADEFFYGDRSIFQNYINVFEKFSFKGVDKSYISSIFGYIVDDATTKEFTFFDFLFNSFIYCFIGSFCKTFVACLCGYLVSKYKYKFSKFIYTVMLIVMAIPIVGSAPSFLKVTMNLGLYDSYLGMFLFNLNFTGIYFFVFVAYFDGMSDVYTEAAEIDGANQFKIFFKIVFPLVAKLFWTVFLLNFITLWNDYQNPLLYYPNHPTLSYAVYRMDHDTSGGGTVNTVEKIAGCMILVIPVLILFLSTKKVLLGNMSAGGIKE